MHGLEVRTDHAMARGSVREPESAFGLSVSQQQTRRVDMAILARPITVDSCQDGGGRKLPCSSVLDCGFWVIAAAAKRDVLSSDLDTGNLLHHSSQLRKVFT